MALTAECTRLIWRSIQAWLRAPSRGPQWASMRAMMAASQAPSAKASHVRTSTRSRPEGGINLPTGDRVST